MTHTNHKHTHAAIAWFHFSQLLRRRRTKINFPALQCWPESLSSFMFLQHHHLTQDNPRYIIPLPFDIKKSPRAWPLVYSPLFTARGFLSTSTTLAHAVRFGSAPPMWLSLLSTPHKYLQSKGSSGIANRGKDTYCVVRRKQRANGVPQRPCLVFSLLSEHQEAWWTVLGEGNRDIFQRSGRD